MKTPIIDKKEILEKTDFASLYKEIVSEFKETKIGQASGLCPFHDDHNPSLFLNLKSGVFHCFPCDAKGNAIDLCMKAWNLPFKETLYKLAERAGIEAAGKAQSSERIHIYYSGSENPLYRKRIFKSGNKKSASFERYENGQYIKGLQGVKQILYNLHKLKESGH